MKLKASLKIYKKNIRKCLYQRKLTIPDFEAFVDFL